MQSHRRRGQRAPLLFSSKYSCPVCDYSLPELEPRLFSFNSPVGACPTCDGLGVSQFFDPARVVVHPELSLAAGAVRGWDRRNAYYFQLIASLAQALRVQRRHAVAGPATKSSARPCCTAAASELVTFTYLTEAGGRTPAQAQVRGHRAQPRTPLPRNRIAPRCARNWPSTSASAPAPNAAARASTARRATCSSPTSRCRTSSCCRSTKRSTFFQHLNLPGWRGEIAVKIVKEIGDRLRFLVDVGLDYLTLERKADTLSGGEAQRIRLASQIGAGLVGVMYVLDEPSIGLHQRDNERLLGTLTRLRDLGNTVIVVEHDEDAIRLADHIVDIGPGAGVHGGEIVAQGSSRTSSRRRARSPAST